MSLLENDPCDGCKQKGLCCSFAVLESGTMWLLPNVHCKFLYKKSGECTIYEKRHYLNPECADMDKMSKHGGMPSKCNYHEFMSFRYKTRIASIKNERRLFKKLQKLWKKHGTPFSYDKELSHG